jgi:uncharacterized membrane protein
MQSNVAYARGLGRAFVGALRFALLVSLFLLWVFGRTEGSSVGELTEYVVVLSSASVLGAGLAHAVVGEQRE